MIELLGSALLVTMVIMVWESEKMIEDKKRGKR
jgi:hypothetical protein